jgi:hypothetical protein
MLYCATVGMFVCIETHFGKQGLWLPTATANWLGNISTFPPPPFHHDHGVSTTLYQCSVYPQCLHFFKRS